jgi:hypothetical protein
MIADGFFAKEWVPHGRDAQSMAFFSAPGWTDQHRRVGWHGRPSAAA